MSQTFILVTLGIVTVLTFGGFIRSGYKNAQRLRGTTVQDLLAAKANELDRAERDWVVPPELKLAPPRPVEYSPLAVRRSRSRPRLAIALLLAIASFWFAALIYYGFSPTLMLQAFRDYLTAPYWRAWMSVPLAVYGGWFALYCLAVMRKFAKERRLLERGTPARARLTISAWGGQRTCLFEFRDAAGTLHRIDQYLPIPPEGGAAIVTVLYDPARPGDFMCYPGSRYAIAGAA
jgi:hypothetical protein